MQERFNRYCLTKEIASKPFGSAYLAHRINHASQKMALKIFKAAYFTSEQQGQNFLHQVERIRQLRHSSIVPILDLGIEQGHPYAGQTHLTFEVACRASLQDELYRNSSLRSGLPGSFANLDAFALLRTLC